jgi:hypothetical protein
VRRFIVAVLAGVAVVLTAVLPSTSGGLKWAIITALALAAVVNVVSTYPKGTTGSREDSSRAPEGTPPAAPQDSKASRKNSRPAARGTGSGSLPTPAMKPPAKSKPPRQRVKYPAITRRRWLVAAYLLPLIMNIFSLLVLVPMLRNPRSQALRVNAALSLELWISLFAAICVQAPANGYYHTAPWAYRLLGDLSDFLSTMMVILILYCIIMVANHRQPVIAGFTRAAFWVADRARKSR